MNDDGTTVQSHRRPETLEPRVAKLELGMERLSEDVKDLANVVRIQGQTVEQEIQKLVVAVTQAQAPKRTDWGVLISAFGLIMALGAAVLIPINNAASDNKFRVEQYHQSMAEHQKLDNHPVGAALVQRLEEQMKMHADNNAKEFAAHVARDEKEYEQIRDVIKNSMACEERYFDAKIALVRAEIAGMQGKNDLYIDKLFGRVVELEKERIKVADNEHAELMLWRQKAMGLSAPDSYVPLVPRGAEVHASPSEVKK